MGGRCFTACIQLPYLGMSTNKDHESLALDYDVKFYTVAPASGIREGRRIECAISSLVFLLGILSKSARRRTAPDKSSPRRADRTRFYLQACLPLLAWLSLLSPPYPTTPTLIW